jgi:hypothetical protein
MAARQYARLLDGERRSVAESGRADADMAVKQRTIRGVKKGRSRWFGKRRSPI